MRARGRGQRCWVSSAGVVKESDPDDTWSPALLESAWGRYMTQHTAWHTEKMCLERVAERVSSLSKLKSVLVTDSHVQLLQRPCLATYGHEQRRRRLPSSSGDALPER